MSRETDTYPCGCSVTMHTDDPGDGERDIRPCKAHRQDAEMRSAWAFKRFLDKQAQHRTAMEEDAMREMGDERDPEDAP